MLSWSRAARCSAVLAFALASASGLAACSRNSVRSENAARLSLLRATAAATFVPQHGVLVAEHTWPLCSADSRPNGSFERQFRVDGSVDRARTEATRELVGDGWRVRARRGGSAVQGVWFDRRFPGWTGMAELLTNTSASRSALSIFFAAPSDKDC